MPEERCFQLEKNVSKNLLPGYLFSNIATFCHRRTGLHFRICLIFNLYFVHERDVYLGFTARRNKLHPIYRAIKNQDDFIICDYQMGICTITG